MKGHFLLSAFGDEGIWFCRSKHYRYLRVKSDISTQKHCRLVLWDRYKLSNFSRKNEIISTQKITKRKVKIKHFNCLFLGLFVTWLPHKASFVWKSGMITEYLVEWVAITLIFWEFWVQISARDLLSEDFRSFPINTDKWRDYITLRALPSATHSSSHTLIILSLDAVGL